MAGLEPGGKAIGRDSQVCGVGEEPRFLFSTLQRPGLTSRASTSQSPVSSNGSWFPVPSGSAPPLQSDQDRSQLPTRWAIPAGRQTESNPHTLRTREEPPLDRFNNPISLCRPVEGRRKSKGRRRRRKILFMNFFGLYVRKTPVLLFENSIYFAGRFL